MVALVLPGTQTQPPLLKKVTDGGILLCEHLMRSILRNTHTHTYILLKHSGLHRLLVFGMRVYTVASAAILRLLPPSNTALIHLCLLVDKKKKEKENWNRYVNIFHTTYINFYKTNNFGLCCIVKFQSNLIFDVFIKGHHLVHKVTDKV